MIQEIKYKKYEKNRNTYKKIEIYTKKYKYIYKSLKNGDFILLWNRLPYIKIYNNP